MTEAEWLACTEPSKMIAALGRNPSKRKRRLFGCECCRRVWSLLSDERSRSAVIAAERFADGLADAAELERFERAAKWAESEQIDSTGVGRSAAWACARVASTRAGEAVDAWQSIVYAKQRRRVADRGSQPGNPDFAAIMKQVDDEEHPEQSAIFRDIFGNPFRPVSVDPIWRTSTVFALAEGIYADRAFDRLPILADALQDAGCEDADILTHLRGNGPHVRGCWAVDLILGKQ
jgi:hypothetical protein